MVRLDAEERLRSILSKYIPPAALDYSCGLVTSYKPYIKITKARSSKLGDYTPPHSGRPHQVTVNHNLNAFSFLITFIHEMAHMDNWLQYKNKVLPHGSEWKQSFKRLMQPLLNTSVFPEDVLLALSRYMNNPAASSCSDVNLLRVLRKYDADALPTVETLPEGSIFKLHNGLILQKGVKLRKRYKCMEPGTKRMYLVSPVAEVLHVSE